MEMSISPSFNPHVKNVLRSFKSEAERSLKGPRSRFGRWPSSEMSEMPGYNSMEVSLKKAYSSESTISAPSTPSFLPMPIFLPMDRTHCEKTDTYLQGHRIACFVVGGEPRLCLPQILNTVLFKFTLPQINAVCDKLQIYVCRCNPEQLEALKMTGILPLDSRTCGLITKTDALRLCASLQQGFSAADRMDRVPGPDSFLVCHECFGKCKGHFHPELYSKEDAACIECTDCRGLYSPPQFVQHSHKSQESRTCHWGFDPSNWRSYLLLAKDHEANDSLQKALDSVKARFDLKSQKRRETVNIVDDSKRARYEVKSDAAINETGSSAFRHWTPSDLSALKEGKSAMVPPAFLQTGPPILLNPESVVPFKDNQRYDPGFAPPNVSLAPQPKEERKEEEAMDTHRPSSPMNDASSLPDKPTLVAEHQELVTLFRRALSGEFKDHEASVGDFIRVQARQEEKIRDLWRSNIQYRKEVEVLRRSQQQSNDESATKSARLERQLEQADREHTAQLRRHHEDRNRLSRQLEQAKKEIEELKAKSAAVKQQQEEDHISVQSESDDDPPKEQLEASSAMDTSDVEIKQEDNVKTEETA